MESREAIGNPKGTTNPTDHEKGASLLIISISISTYFYNFIPNYCDMQAVPSIPSQTALWKVPIFKQTPMFEHISRQNNLPHNFH